jgi:hypothetical protein
MGAGSVRLSSLGVSAFKLKNALWLALALAAVALAAAGRAAPTQTTLLLNGRNSDDGTYHLGTFKAAAPLCATGSWLGHGDGTRTFTCADGSGTFDASFDASGAVETHGGTAPWQIVSGTGRYVDLRGQGSATATLTGPEPTWTNAWQGVVDFDAVAPTLTSFAASIKRSRTLIDVHIVATVEDNVPANSVSYRISASRGADVIGETQGPLVATFKLPRRRHPKSLRVFFALRDPVGNLATIARTVRLPGR